MVYDETLHSSLRIRERTKTRNTVLLIDDEELVRASVKQLLENLGWLVLDAGSRLEALDIVSREQVVSLVVCDVRLGEEQGFEVVNVLQTAGLNAPVLYITGYASRGSQELQHNEHLLVKPFRSDELKQAIQKVLH
jgi:CheY-like chemotaxis protein